MGEKDITDRIADFLELQSNMFAPIKNLHLPKQSDLETTGSSDKNKPQINVNTAVDIKPTLDSFKSLEELKQLCAIEEELRTDLPNTNLVFGVGNPSADLMLIGEAPGEQEDIKMEPFVGKAGQLLDKILAAINFKRSDVYIANILKHRPPDNRNPTSEERAKSLPYLEKQIELVNPKLILCLGLVSAHTLLKTSISLKNLRGKFHNYKGKYELMVTYHPAALLRNPTWKRGTWDDVQKLRKRYNDLNCKP